MSDVRGETFGKAGLLRAQWVARETDGRERVTMRWVADGAHKRGVRPS